MENNLAYNEKQQLCHLPDIESLKVEDMIKILDLAQTFLDDNQNILRKPLAKAVTCANLFFENSTRTRCSFELAEHYLQTTVLNLDIDTSSTTKGETILDTIDNLAAMSVNLFVIRHHETTILKDAIKQCRYPVSFINAGSGSHAHPTQALLDVLTIRQYKKNIANLNVAIVGDVQHSRVARSTISALQKLNVANINVIGPASLVPDDLDMTDVNICRDLKPAIADADVIMTLRLQKERMQSTLIKDETQYYDQYGLTQTNLKHCKADAIIMHPGPMNRGIEIESSIANGPQSVILQQVRNGTAVRMAVIALLAEQL